MRLNREILKVTVNCIFDVNLLKCLLKKPLKVFRYPQYLLFLHINKLMLFLETMNSRFQIHSMKDFCFPQLVVAS